MTALALAALFLFAGSAANAADENLGGWGEIKTEMVAMRDGVKLATDVQLPSNADGPLPTVLLRTPYQRNLGGPMGLIRGFIGSDYAVVSQDTRGRYDSEGENLPFLTDQEDGYDTVKWIASQPWSDGRIGMVGASALGITGYQAAIANPEELKCVVSGVAPADLFSEAIFWDGELRKDLAVGWTVGTNYPMETFEFLVQHPFYDDFARIYDLDNNAHKVTVPMLHFGGWYDIFTEGTLHSFNAVQQKGGDGARGMQKLIMGPWTHAGAIVPQQGSLKYPVNSVILQGKIKEMMDWMGDCLNGKPMPEEKPVDYYLMGDVDTPSRKWNIWKQTTLWPPENEEIAWGLSTGGELVSDGSTGSQTFLEYAYDPRNPVPTVGGGNLTIGTAGPEDQQEIEKRDDVLVFDSPVLEEPVGIAGAVYADLLVSTDACDTDFTAKISDVYPDGRSMLIADGIARASFRGSREKATPVVKNEKMRIKVYIGDTALVFNKGHKIRLAVSSSNHPRFLVNPNTCSDSPFPIDMLEAEYKAFEKDKGKSAHEGIEYLVANNKVFVGGDDGSKLILPRIAVE